ncbi:2-hydroxy-3-keto-5-methylthiopentenyl-1-phosphate phosphatase [Bacillus massiliglaciei]|uniref:2-hydroxy-3-keto-5-methylthiopentenyl-1- phosphate phosphatase n=1 Tax=Bacillus massiliglaciei TaxID=1816693 RepID=UPI000AC01456|nr:2-hydroxy-3-keto-5-methylthiopentenyl-1-phosphate phosphatase [Bacillus massiliglaciei]
MKPIIFCDFDGTVTDSDNIISIMKHFGPKGWEKWKDQVLNQEISISEGVGNMFALLESEKKEEIIRYVKETAKIRPGFTEMVQYAKAETIPFFIVSGGMDFFIEPLLQEIISPKFVYCNKAHFDQNDIRIEWPYTCDDLCTNHCGCCKPSIMRSLSEKDHFKIVIGDSVTDFEAAKKADLVIARDRLLEECIKQGITHCEFTDFFDVIEIVKQNLEVKA